MKPTTLLSRTLEFEAQRHAATVAAIESRTDDLRVVDRLLAALWARGWKADAYVETKGAAYAAEARIRIAASVTRDELSDLLGWLTCDGVSCVRVSNGDMGPSRHYLLRLDRFSVTLDAYVHPTKVAA